MIEQNKQIFNFILLNKRIATRHETKTNVFKTTSEYKYYIIDQILAPNKSDTELSNSI